jgi:hypothetical protein
MIIIGKPEIIYNENKARLQTDINVDGNIKSVWFEVEKKYGEYLCYERSDAFVIGVLNYAMRNGHDIRCIAPMGEELHYQLTNYLIEAVYKNSKTLYKIKLISDIDTTILKSANAVGTGISCGIDSFHAISTHTSTIYPNHNITHLAFNNVGSHGEGERAVELYNARKKMAMDFSNEYGFEFVKSNSNIYDVIPQNHLLTNTYTSCFAIYCMQKLYSVYYYASAHAFFEFSLIDSEKKSTAYYDLLILNNLTTKSLKILSQGATETRLEKIQLVSEYMPSYKYLNVCTQTAINCNKCEKCTRTLLALDALGKLDNYSSVFDINYYRKNAQKYYTKLIYYKLLKNIYYVEIYPLLKGKISILSRIKGYIKLFELNVKSIIPESIKKFLKRILKKQD